MLNRKPRPRVAPLGVPCGAEPGTDVPALVDPALVVRSPQQIGAADDADHTAVLHHGHALDVMLAQQPRDLGQVGVGGNGDDRCRHHIAGGTSESAATLKRHFTRANLADRLGYARLLRNQYMQLPQLGDNLLRFIALPRRSILRDAK